MRSATLSIVLKIPLEKETNMNIKKATQSTPPPIGGAVVNIQELNTNGTAWHNLGTLQTSSTGKETVFFAGSYTPKNKGYHILKATYDGDNNYTRGEQRGSINSELADNNCQVTCIYIINIGSEILL